MAMLERVTKGKIQRPILALIYGPDGAGKSTFAADAPSPIFLGKENGTNSLDVTRLPEPKNYNDIMVCLEELRTCDHDYQTLAIDSLDWIEPLVWQAVCQADGAKSIEDVGGGYGKGYTQANDVWRKMITELARLRDAKNMNIIVIAHSQIKVFNDPSQPAPYDRYQLKLNEKAAALWREFVDFVGFATFEVYTKTSKDGQRSKAFGDGKRVLLTERRPSFDAKNRLGLPFELPLSFEAFQSACEKGKPDVKNDINDLISLLTDTEMKKKAEESVQKAGADSAQLAKILNRLRVVVAA